LKWIKLIIDFSAVIVDKYLFEKIKNALAWINKSNIVKINIYWWVVGEFGLLSIVESICWIFPEDENVYLVLYVLLWCVSLASIVFSFWSLSLKWIIFQWDIWFFFVIILSFF
jgi:hypothetical protein